ncbi:DUF1684 domain-containing protein [Isoptericola sp. b490]|uniref:DUF1684 domain-containing protein n=1 Tax=Actinotalea lenta TaxID=3064654 RepID=UPI0027143944|nr:DUF1684 domain-containing protein [Isoptericola sp. b490]MDO8121968.1 DUF1684 domain-containing protein [Isoptericola sp. b490]
MDALPLLDWRRSVASLYAEVRATAEPADGHALWCAGRETLLRDHPQSPVPTAARAEFRLRTWPYDPAYRFVVPVLATEDEVRSVSTPTDGLVSQDRVGRVQLGDLGGLDVWWLAVYGGGVFVPLRDATSGDTTYGGGRYVLDTAKGADLGGGRRDLVIDLNFAYPPSCAYDPAWVCPLPGAGNRLDAAVPVGEQVQS